MRVLVCGGRDYHDYVKIKAVLEDFARTRRIELIIEGGAPGADKGAAQWAKRAGVPLMEFPAPWEAHGKRAGAIRNQWMLKYGQPDIVIAFPGGAGTMNMVKLATMHGIEILPIGREIDQQSIIQTHLDLAQTQA